MREPTRRSSTRRHPELAPFRDQQGGGLPRYRCGAYLLRPVLGRQDSASGRVCLGVLACGAGGICVCRAPRGGRGFRTRRTAWALGLRWTFWAGRALGRRRIISHDSFLKFSQFGVWFRNSLRRRELAEQIAGKERKWVEEKVTWKRRLVPGRPAGPARACGKRAPVTAKTFRGQDWGVVAPKPTLWEGTRVPGVPPGRRLTGARCASGGVLPHFGAGGFAFSGSFRRVRR